MDPITIALMLQSLAEGTKEGLGAAMTAASKINRLSPEQKTKMKELERNQALGLLGLDQAQEQQILSQQLQPVQTSLREALNRQAQQQQIQDVGQGAAFRGQQALLETGQEQASRAVQRGQQTVAQLNELETARQLAELDQLQKQRQTNRQAVAEIAQGLITGGTTAAAGIVGAETATSQIKLREAAMKAALKQADVEIVNDAINAQGKNKASSDFSNNFLGLLNKITGNAPVISSTPTTSSPNNVLQNLLSLQNLGSFETPTNVLLQRPPQQISDALPLQNQNATTSDTIQMDQTLTPEQLINFALTGITPLPKFAQVLQTDPVGLQASLPATLQDNMVIPAETSTQVQSLQVGQYIPNKDDHGYVVKEIDSNGQVTKIAFKAGNKEYGVISRFSTDPTKQAAFLEFDNLPKPTGQ